MMMMMMTMVPGFVVYPLMLEWPLHHHDRSQGCCPSRILPWDLGTLRHKPTQMQHLEDGKKGLQYLFSLWLFLGLGTMVSLWCGFISLRPQPRMVAVLWRPPRKSVLVFSLCNVAGRELDNMRKRREKGGMGCNEDGQKTYIEKLGQYYSKYF